MYKIQGLEKNMIEDFILPDIGEGIVECELVEWLVKEGELVEEDQAVADVQTDKALVQIPSKHAGRVEKLYVKQGDIAKVHAPLFQIVVTEDGEADQARREAPSVQQPAEPAKVEHVSQSIAPNDSATRKVLATPAVRRIARENNVDIDQVAGSGPQGRVLKADMLSFVQSGATTEKSDSVSRNSNGQAGSVSGNVSGNVVAMPDSKAVSQTQAVEVIPMKGIRAIMAAQMQKSVSTIPHFTYAEEIDITGCNETRRELNISLGEHDQRLTLMAFFIKSLSMALQAFPIVNSHMTEDGSEIHQLREHNIGMAVDSPMGLLVPNIKSVNQLSLLDVAREVKRLTDAGRAGRLAPDDMKNGTITISNIGAIGGTVTTPIINAPEVAIVGIGRIQKLPRPVNEDELEIRELITVSWSGDHRVIDGGTIARFNNHWKQLLENPTQMLLHLK
jgi:2-oxoisovalerate dehydrogenase E2 component (dihydrolipoyl transacylase)